MFRNFINRLEHQLGQDLPGEETQFSMAPFARIRIAEIEKKNYDPKKSAVLILLFPEGDSIYTLLIQRQDYEGVHSGQVAFPGGKFEENDIELKQTALRETAEEVGVIPADIQILGSLTDVYIPPSNYLVKPFVGFVSKKPQFIIDPFEVKQIIPVDLFALNDIKIVGKKVIMQSSGYKIKTPYYDIEGFTVWGQQQ